MFVCIRCIMMEKNGGDIMPGVKVNCYGLEIKGLRAAAGYITNLGRECAGGYYEIFYDRADGQIWTVYNISAEERRTYPSPKIISVCTTRKHMTMQQIVDKLRERLEE